MLAAPGEYNLPVQLIASMFKNFSPGGSFLKVAELHGRYAVVRMAVAEAHVKLVDVNL